MFGWQEHFRKVIEDDFRKRQEKNPLFSMRQYSRKIGLSPGAVSDILKGRRQLSISRGLEVVERLEISPSVRRRLYALMGHSPRDGAKKEAAGDRSVLRDLKAHAVLALLDQDGESASDEERLAERLKMPRERLRSMISNLKDLGLLRESERGGWLVEGDGRWSGLMSPEDLRSIYVDAFEGARNSLESGSTSMDRYGTLVISATPRQLEEIREEIFRAIDRVLAVETASVDGKSLVQLTLAFAPLEFAGK